MKGATKSGDENVQKEHGRKPKKDVSFQQDIDQEFDQESNFERRGSPSYGSMQRSSVKAAKNALAKTAAYFSVRVPKKPNIFSRNQRNKNESSTSDVNDLQEETTCDSKPFENQPSDDNKTSTFLTAEACHSLNTKTSSPHSFVIEATQTSTLTLHSSPKNEMNNNLNTSGEANIVNTDFNCKEDQIRWGTPKNSTHWAYSPSETSNFQKQSSYYSNSNLSDLGPTPAPRNANVRPRPTYQNIPSSSKVNTNIIPTECQIEQPHEMHVLPVEVCFCCCHYFFNFYFTYFCFIR